MINNFCHQHDWCIKINYSTKADCEQIAVVNKCNVVCEENKWMKK